MRLITADGPAASPARVRPPERGSWRVGLIQHHWRPDPDELRGHLADGVATAAGAGARLVCLAELTLLPYVASTPAGPAALGIAPEPLDGGPTVTFAAEQARRHGVWLAASVWEADASVAPLGFNTAVLVDPDGVLVAATRKTHIPVTAGYREDHYFAPGDSGYPVHTVDGAAALGLPTCWDEWFPEVARAYALGGADVVVYPTAIGSEPDHPDFDTMPLWRHVIVSHAIANGLFVVVPNRTGTERVGGDDAPELEFYGSSFVADPYGRVLVEAPRGEPAALVADLDLDARRDWLELFPFLTTRRPDTYEPLTRPLRRP